MESMTDTDEKLKEEVKNDKNEKLKSYESSVRHRVACEERAFHIVNRLIEGSVEGSYLRKCGHLISREHYNDIVEERAVSFLCGYPLCENGLENIPKKRFHISTRTNRVFDISERKNFCSNQCHKASKHFKNEIPESPLWMREKELLKEIKLLPHRNTKGMVGEEILGPSAKKLLEDEVKMLEELDNKTSSSIKKANTTDTHAMDVKSKKGGMTSFKSSMAATERKTMKESVQVPSLEQSTDRDTDIENTPLSTESQASVIGSDTSAEQLLKDSVERLSISEQNDRDCATSSQSDSKTRQASGDSEIQSIMTEVGELPERSKEKSDYSVSASLIQIENNLLDNDATAGSRENENKQVPADSDSESKKLDRLTALLSKRKNILSGMVDIQMLVPNSLVEKCKAAQTERQSSQSMIDSAECDSSVNVEHEQQLDSPLSVDNFSEQAVMSEQGAGHSPFSGGGNHQKPVSKSKSSRKSKSSPHSPLEHIATVLKTWITDHTVSYLLSSSAADDADVPQHFSDPKIQSGYAALCKRLSTQEKDFEEIVGDTDGVSLEENTNRTLKSAPDYAKLREEVEAFQLKVTEFLTGKKPKPPKKGTEKDDDRDPVYIPTVDAYDQLQIRIKIVLDRLDKCMPDLLGPLCLSVQDVSSLVRELVYTFRLEKDNIVFKPSEWTLVAIFLLKMLSLKNRNIADAFTKESAACYFSIVLKGIGHCTADLDVLIRDMFKDLASSHS